MRSNARPQQHERRCARTKMTRNEIIEKTLKEMGPLEPENELPYSEEPDYQESVIAELLSKLPDTEKSRPATTSNTLPLSVATSVMRATPSTRCCPPPLSSGL